MFWALAISFTAYYAAFSAMTFHIVIAFPASVGALFAFALLYGGANGIITIVRGTAVPELMWREGYGAINGALTVPANIAKALAPFGAAALWSAAGGYDAVLWAIFGSGAVAALLFVRTAGYARWARMRSGG